MKLRVAFVLCVAALALSGCVTQRTRTVELPGGVSEEAPRAPSNNWLDRMLGTDRTPNVGPCPLMGVLYDNARMVTFANPAEERYANITYTAEMQGVRGLCRYVGEDPIRMSIEVDMSFGRGPAATADRQTYRYWVAVTRRGRAPIEREFFEVDVRFPRGEAVVNRTEEIEEIIIPRANADVSGENFEILVGFELTPEQVAFNRDGRRFRIDAGAAPTPGQ
jgi:hypothetical protein